MKKEKGKMKKEKGEKSSVAGWRHVREEIKNYELRITNCRRWYAFP